MAIESVDVVNSKHPIKPDVDAKGPEIVVHPPAAGPVRPPRDLFDLASAGLNKGQPFSAAHDEVYPKPQAIVTHDTSAGVVIAAPSRAGAPAACAPTSGDGACRVGAGTTLAPLPTERPIVVAPPRTGSAALDRGTVDVPAAPVPTPPKINEVSPLRQNDFDNIAFIDAPTKNRLIVEANLHAAPGVVIGGGQVEPQALTPPSAVAKALVPQVKASGELVGPASLSPVFPVPVPSPEVRLPAPAPEPFVRGPEIHGEPPIAAPPSIKLDLDRVGTKIAPPVIEPKSDRPAPIEAPLVVAPKTDRTAPMAAPLVVGPIEAKGLRPEPNAIPPAAAPIPRSELLDPHAPSILAPQTPQHDLLLQPGPPARRNEEVAPPQQLREAPTPPGRTNVPSALNDSPSNRLTPRALVPAPGPAIAAPLDTPKGEFRPAPPNTGGANVNALGAILDRGTVGGTQRRFGELPIPPSLVPRSEPNAVPFSPLNRPQSSPEIPTQKFAPPAADQPNISSRGSIQRTFSPLVAAPHAEPLGTREPSRELPSALTPNRETRITDAVSAAYRSVGDNVVAPFSASRTQLSVTTMTPDRVQRTDGNAQPNRTLEGSLGVATRNLNPAQPQNSAIAFNPRQPIKPVAENGQSTQSQPGRLPVAEARGLADDHTVIPRQPVKSGEAAPVESTPATRIPSARPQPGAPGTAGTEKVTTAVNRTGYDVVPPTQFKNPIGAQQSEVPVAGVRTQFGQRLPATNGSDTKSVRQNVVDDKANPEIRIAAAAAAATKVVIPDALQATARVESIRGNETRIEPLPDQTPSIIRLTLPAIEQFQIGQTAVGRIRPSVNAPSEGEAAISRPSGISLVINPFGRAVLTTSELQNSSARVATSKLSEAVATAKGAETVSPLKFAGTVAAPKLSEIVAAPKLSEIVAAPKLSEIVAAPKLSEIVAAPKLGETVAAPKLGETVAAPKLSETVAAPKLGETVAAPKLSETVSIRPEGATKNSVSFTMNGSVETRLINMSSANKFTVSGSTVAVSRELLSGRGANPSPASTFRIVQAQFNGKQVLDELELIGSDKTQIADARVNPKTFLLNPRGGEGRLSGETRLADLSFEASKSYEGLVRARSINKLIIDMFKAASGNKSSVSGMRQVSISKESSREQDEKAKANEFNLDKVIGMQALNKLVDRVSDRDSVNRLAQQPGKQIQPVSQSRTRYRVQEGDTLESIATNKLGDPRFVTLLITINRAELHYSELSGRSVPIVFPEQMILLPSTNELEIHRKHYFGSKSRSDSGQVRSGGSGQSKMFNSFGNTETVRSGGPGLNRTQSKPDQEQMGKLLQEFPCASDVLDWYESKQPIQNSEEKTQTPQQNVANFLNTLSIECAPISAPPSPIACDPSAIGEEPRAIEAEKLSDNCRIVTMQGTVCSIALQTAISGKWFSVAKYDCSTNETIRVLYHKLGSSARFSIDLPVYVAIQMAKEDFRRNYHLYCLAYAANEQVEFISTNAEDVAFLK